MRGSESRRNLVAVLLFLAIPLLITGATPHQAPRPPALFKDARQMLAIARAQGRSEVTLLIAALPGGADAVARRAEQLGGEIRHRADPVGYLRVRLPIDRATELAGFDRIEAVTLDFASGSPSRLLPDAGGWDQVGEDAPRLAAPVADTAPWPPRWSDYPLRQPYRALRDIQGDDLLALNPAFDGRGVTIAVLDGNIDFLLPEFQTAYDLKGQLVPKFADYLNASDPREDAEDTPQWVDMGAVVTAAGRRVAFEGRTFATPRDGAFRIGLFSERRFNDPGNAAYMDQDVDRNGNPRGDDGLFGVLWDEATNEVWVDIDRDLSFADQRSMTDYRVRNDVGVFGTDDPATPVRESIGFTVQTNARDKFISLNLGIYQHATEIMGHVVGNPEPRGRLRGVAPGARLVSVYYGGSNLHGLIEGLIIAFEHPLTDLIVLEQSVNLASIPYLLADGRHPISIIAQRLIDRHQKLLFVPGSNAPGMGIVAEDGLAPGAVSAGGYQHRDSYLVNNGFEPEPADNMHWGGLSHGPSGIGALKPDFLAPSGQVSVDIGYVYRPSSQERRGLYQLPAGYFVDGGTSTAAPMAAGAAALVVSAARQTGVPHDAVRLKAALMGSARHIPRLAAHEQGSGLVQVRAAYELLRSMGGGARVAITSQAPVRTRLSHLLATPHTGVGLYEREGWSVGDRGTRTIRLTRTSGPREAMRFTARWIGNDGTYRSASEVTLPLNRTVEFPVEISVDSAGVHSALLVLEHPGVPGYAHQVLHTVIAALRPDAGNGHSVRASLSIPRPGDRGVFVAVPPGAAALYFSATSEDGAAVRLRAILPGRTELNPCAPAAPAGQPCSVPLPEPGVWEINASMHDMVRDYDPNRPRPLPPGRATVTVTVLGVGMAIEPRSPPAAGSGQDLTVALTNRFGAFATALAPTALGSAHQATRTITQGEQHVYEVVVPRGATSLRVRVSDVAAPGADLDLYLMDCTALPRAASPPPPEREAGNKAPSVAPPACPPRGKAATVDSDGEVEVRDPSPGRWVIVVDGYAVPEGGTSYRYLDVFAHPRFGSLAFTEVEEPRPAGARWTTTAHAWVAALPDGGRTLWAQVQVVGREARTAQGTPIPLGVLDLPLGRPGAMSGGR